MPLTVFLVFIVSFALTFFSVFLYKKINSQKKFCLGKDINKKEEPALPEGTGIAMLAGIWAAAFASFFFTEQKNPAVLISAATATFFSFAGFIDDLKNKFEKTTTSWIIRAAPIAIFSFFAGFAVSRDLFQGILFGLFIAVVASFQNTFAGLNGWETGSGFIISVFTAFIVKGTFLFLPAVGLVACILALLLFNVFPAKVFPGDAGTLLIGSAIATISISTNDPKIIVLTGFFFLPHTADFLLKFFTNPLDMTQQKTRPYRLLENGLLDIPDKKKQKLDFAKFLIKIFGPMHEKKIVQIIWGTVFLNCIFWTTIFFMS